MVREKDVFGRGRCTYTCIFSLSLSSLHRLIFFGSSWGCILAEEVASQWTLDGELPSQNSARFGSLTRAGTSERPSAVLSDCVFHKSTRRVSGPILPGRIPRAERQAFSLPARRSTGSAVCMTIRHMFLFLARVHRVDRRCATGPAKERLRRSGPDLHLAPRVPGRTCGSAGLRPKIRGSVLRWLDCLWFWLARLL